MGTNEREEEEPEIVGIDADWDRGAREFNHEDSKNTKIGNHGFSRRNYENGVSRDGYGIDRIVPRVRGRALRHSILSKETPDGQVYRI